MADHPPEKSVRQGEADVKKTDPHGVGTERQQAERAKHNSAAMPTDDRQSTENAHRGGADK